MDETDHTTNPYLVRLAHVSDMLGRSIGEMVLMIVFVEGRRIEIKEPSPPTLKKYGLTLIEWKDILSRQGYRCPVCTRVMEKRICIDHNHAQGWSKLKPEKRKLHVRGLTCWFCNHYYLGRSITVQKARNVVSYLESFEKRRPR